MKINSTLKKINLLTFYAIFNIMFVHYFITNDINR